MIRKHNFRSVAQVCLPLALCAMIFALPQAHSEETAAPHAVSFSYKLDEPRRVSAVVYDSDGVLVRELLHAVPQEAGEYTLLWDALDAQHRPVEKGDYTWRILKTDGLRAEYLISLGSNYPPGDTWRTASGPGTHGTPMGIAVDGTGIYVSASTTENIETCMLKMKPDGTERLWSTLHPIPWDGARALAADEGEVFMLGHRHRGQKPQSVYVYDSENGDRVRSIDVRLDKESTDVDATDMDKRGESLVVAYAEHDRLRFYDPDDGDVIEERKISSPRGVAIGEDGSVYVISQNRLIRITEGKKKISELADGLPQPGRLAFDHSSGDILIYLKGTRQIVRLDETGSKVKRYGREGGRQPGLYDEAAKRSFAGFGDLTAGLDGGFYVTEPKAAPRRTAHFDRDGHLIREWYGGQRWAPHGTPEPDDPRAVWVGSQYGWVMRVIADYDAGMWEVHSTYHYAPLADGLVGDSWNERGYFRIREHDGTKYFVLEKMPTVLRIDEDNWQLVPATVCGSTRRAPDFLKEWADGKRAFQWNDADGDGKPEKEEMTFYERGLGSRFQPVIDDEFNCYFISMHPEPYVVRKAEVTEWNDAGAPIYGDLPLGEKWADVPERFSDDRHQDTRWAAYLHHDTATGDLYGAFNSWTRSWGDSADSFMHRWDEGGEPRWTVSRQGDVPGMIYNNLRGIAGTPHDTVLAIDFDGGWNMRNLARSYLWDRNGLYVGGIMDNPDLDGIEKFWYQLSGEFCHSSTYTLPDGDVLFFGNWENEIRAYRVSGWKDWERQEGTITVDQPPEDGSGQGLAARYFADADMTETVAVRVDETIDSDAQRTGDLPQHAAVRRLGTIVPEYGPRYTGPWISRRDRAASGGNLRGSRDGPARVEFRFRGRAVRVTGRTGPQSGYANFYLDGERVEKHVDCYSEERKNGVTMFERDDLAPGDHTVTVEVVGWRGRRNPDSKNSWVYLDKFVVDDKIEVDAAGLQHRFAVRTEGKAKLWLDRKLRLAARDSKETVVQLQRRHVPIQLDCVSGGDPAGITLFWSNPFSEKRHVPTSALYPVAYGAPEDGE